MMLIDILIPPSIINGNRRLELSRLSTVSAKQHQRDANIQGHDRKDRGTRQYRKKDIVFYTIIHTFSDHHSCVNFQHEAHSNQGTTYANLPSFVSFFGFHKQFHHSQIIPARPPPYLIIYIRSLKPKTVLVYCNSLELCVYVAWRL